jgi:multidrug efflux system membrane fusion protein
VWVVQAGSDGRTATVHQRNVTSGTSTGESTSVAQGLAAGEVVITDGGDRLRDGATVNLPPHATAAPAAGGGQDGGGHQHGAGQGGATNGTAPGGRGGGRNNGGGDVGVFGGAG